MGEQQPHQTNVFVQAAQSNGLGVAGFILSLIGIFFCCGWISPLGLLFSLIALFWAPRGFAVAGVVLGMIGSAWLALIGATMTLGMLGVGAAGSAAANSNDPALQKSLSELRTAAEDLADQSELPNDSTTPPPTEANFDEWSAAGTVAEMGDVRVSLLSVDVGKVPLESLGEETTSTDELLMVRIEIMNLNASRKLDYAGWSSSAIYTLNPATLRDEFDNAYARINFGFTTKVVDQVSRESVYPAASINDVLVFERPVASAKELRLRLPGGALGMEGEELRIKFSTALFDPQPEAAPPNEPTPTATPSPTTNAPAAEIESAPAASPAPVETDRGFRTWTSADGKYTVKAKFVKAIAGQVTLEKEGGEQITLPMERLSEEDQTFLREKAK